MKTDNDGNEDFEKVKKYLLDCPLVSADHPAIKAAILAIEKEQQRLERDRKLHMKFAAQNKTSATTANSETVNLEDSVVVVDSRSSSPPARTEDSTDEMMEWQDVEDKEEKDSVEDQTSYLGKTLAKVAIDALSEHKAKVKSPVAAIAVVFHASLRSSYLGFSCTGVPEDESALKGGFAPPVRELPSHQFLPTSWDAKPDKIALRYRKNGSGAMVLLVEQSDDNLTVRLQPASSKEPSSQTLTFSLRDHVNLDSWNAAQKASPTVSPALHYKSLAQLLTNFCRTFDLGPILDEEMSQQASTTSVPYVDNTVVANSIRKSDFVPDQPVEIPPIGGYNRKPNFQFQVPSTLGEAFPGINPLSMGGGDFVGDLAPAGLRDPRFPSAGNGRMGGNLMGPNHPLFRGGPDGGMIGGPMNGIPFGGPGSMQPRFDPIYPDAIDFPNGGGPPGGPRRSNRPSRTGEPNPDHLPPPNAFGGSDNMFS